MESKGFEPLTYLLEENESERLTFSMVVITHLQDCIYQARMSLYVCLSLFYSAEYPLYHLVIIATIINYLKSTRYIFSYEIMLLFLMDLFLDLRIKTSHYISYSLQ